jgi:hypothetical protein
LDTSFADRFVLADTGDGGVLLDLVTGSMHRLNRSASAIAAELALGVPPSEVAANLALRCSLTEASARRDVDVVRAEAQVTAPPRHRPFSYAADGDGWLVQLGGAPLVRVDASGRRVQRVGPADRDARALLLLAAPHVLALHGHAVVHAGAVALDGGVVAFVGASGAGKTTTARALADAGVALVAEDLVVLAPGEGPPRVAVEAEQRVRDWCRDRAAAFDREDELALAADELTRLSAGPTAALRQVHFIAADRRAGVAIEPEALSAGDALALLLDSVFAGLGDRATWRRLFEASRRVASEVPCARTQMPEGRHFLERAARAFPRTGAAHNSKVKA